MRGLVPPPLRLHRRVPGVLLICAALTLSACAWGGSERDADHDGVPADLDCDDYSSSIGPWREELPYNGVDEDCNVDTPDEDLDADGYLHTDDCDDLRADVNPSAAETPYNGADDDCDPATLEDDLDGDGYLQAQDCDDTRDDVSPSAVETPYDDLDNDCDPSSPDDDVDGDGYLLAADCDDLDPDVHPTAVETTYNGADDDCDPATLEDDLDGDGYLLAVDCADDDPDVHPGVTELPFNDVDDDCDAATLDDDGDQDGAPVATDCDDANPAISPLLPETPFNGVNDDCNALTTDFDVDGDGHLTASDCVDTDATVHPGATEVVHNGKDDDCDPATLDDDLDDDGYLVATDCDDYDPTVNPGVADVCGDGIDNDCDAAPTDCGLAGTHATSSRDAALLGVSTWDDAGWRVASGGDVNGDGYDDVLVTAPKSGDGGYLDGAVYLFYGGAGGTLLSGALSLAAADAIFYGAGSMVELGQSVDIVGDLDGDGYDDVAIGTDLAPDKYAPDGALYIFYGGPTASLSGSYYVSSADATIEAIADVDKLGYGMGGAGDVNGDGYDDLLVGAFAADAPSVNSGEVYLFYGGSGVNRLTGTLSASTADARFAGAASSDLVGISVSGVGDVDGDGYDDFVIGAPAVPPAGAAYLFYGGGGAAAPTGTTVVSSADAIFLGEDDGGRLGQTVDAAGDVDGDGRDDFLLGAERVFTGSFDDGAAYLYYGRSAPSRWVGTHTVSSADLRIYSEGNDERTGSCVSGGDVNGDGYSDVLIGSPRFDDAVYGAGAGGAHLFYGGPSRLDGMRVLSDADASFVGSETYDYVGSSVSIAGDIDGDGYDDVLVGAEEANGTEVSSGAAYLFYGQGD